MTMLFLPLVSACSRRSGRHPRNSWAVAYEPVRITAAMSAWVMSRRPASSSSGRDELEDIAVDAGGPAQLGDERTRSNDSEAQA